ncbi:AzlD domain-containing protein [Neptuniibacter sp. QD37_11]|uniref:AzlD domain-containing protein n=1 Tax=Neptuniibacter sp. QD37_11 TaxID=3398209 RepID=UPI0039F5609F
MNDWLLFGLMAIIVFASRYLFLEPRLPLKLNDKALELLSYSAPAVLAAVIGPLVFLQEGKLTTSLESPYIIGALAAIVLMLLTKNTLMTAVLSMGVFFVCNL